MRDNILKLSKNAAIYGLGGVSNQIIGFLMVPVYTRALAVVEYGHLTYFSIIMTVFSTLVTLGLVSSIYRLYPIYEEEGREKEFISTVFLFILGSSLTIASVLFVFSSDFSQMIFKSNDFSLLIRLIIFSSCLASLNAVFYAVIRYADKALFYIIIIISKSILGTALNIYFVVYAGKGVFGILISGATMELVTLVSMAILLRKYLKFRIYLPALRRALKFGSPLILGTVGMYLMSYSGLYFLKNVANKDAVGLYGFALKFSTVISTFIVNPFDQSWSPMRFQLLKKDNAEVLFARILDYIFLVTLSAGFVISVLVPDVIRILSNNSYFAAYKYVPQLCIVPALFAGIRVVTVGSEIAEKTTYRSLLILIAGSLNVVLNLFLVERLSVLGALLSVNISYLTLFVMMLFYSQACYKIQYRFSRTVLLFGFFAISYLLISQIDLGIIPDLIVKPILILTCFVVIYFSPYFYPKERNAIKEILHSPLKERFSAAKIINRLISK